MSTYENAPDKYTTVNDIKTAYRILGPLSNSSSKSNVPLLLNNHFRGTMDHWDPLLLNGLASHRTVLLIDNAGVGRSAGTIPDTYAGWAAHMIAVALALGYKEVDVLGFSMGGFAALMIALNGPAAGLTVRRLIIGGSGPSAGEGITSGDPRWFNQLVSAKTEEEQRKGFLTTFFSPDEKKQKIGAEWWERMTNARPNRSDYLGEEATAQQIKAVIRWSTPGEEERKEGSYDRLHELTIPVLVANGSNDVLVPTGNSIVLWQKLVNAQASLHLYPDSGHGFLDEYARHFGWLVNDFLDEE